MVFGLTGHFRQALMVLTGHLTQAFIVGHFTQVVMVLTGHFSQVVIGLTGDLTQVLMFLTGHFSQVVWKGSKELGVGKAQDGKGKCIVVCNYRPAGNMMGSWKDNVSPPN